MRPILTYLLITLLAVFLPAGHGVKAQSTFSLEMDGNRFTISRSSGVGEETVCYRTISLSAMEGMHYTGVNGSYTFPEGITSKVIRVVEYDHGTGLYRFQTGNSRMYRFELEREDGAMIAFENREITVGMEIPTDYFEEKAISVQTNPIAADDRGYASNGGMFLTASHFFDNAYYREYCSLIDGQLRMQLGFEAMEDDDAYEYVQILFGQPENCDDRSGCSNGDPGTPSWSSYMCGFEHDPKAKSTTYAQYRFPLLSLGDGGPVTEAWSQYGNSIGKLTLQKFKSGSRADDGRLIVPLESYGITARLNASGKSGSDRWYARNGTVYLQVVDPTRPVVITDDIQVSSGRHCPGNTIFVTVPFTDIVTAPDGFMTSYMVTNWGRLYYLEGSGTNVLTFFGTIGSSSDGTLRLLGFSSGKFNNLSGLSCPTQFQFDTGVELDPPFPYPITYDLDGGRLLEENPATYTYDEAVVITHMPIKPGYIFLGWTGSNGTVPQKTVRIEAESSGPRSYTANWAPAWGQNRGADGSETHPYLISSTVGLDMVARIVAGLDGYEADSFAETFFELESDIDYNPNGLYAGQSNFTPIGGYFNGADRDFMGTFDGRGYAVCGIFISKVNLNQHENKNQALFGRLNGATVKNVVLSESSILGYNYVGGIAAICKNSTVKDCLVLDSDISAWKDDYMGAIVARNIDGDLSGNYYYNCRVGNPARSLGVGVGAAAGVDNSRDAVGARSMHLLTLGQNITSSGVGVNWDGDQYYAAGALVTLTYKSVPEGRKALFCCDGTLIEGNSFTMPTADVTVSASLTETTWTFSLTQGTRDGFSAWWGTFYDSAEDYLLSEGATAYTMDRDYRLYRLGEDGRTIPRGTAVIIISTVPGATLEPAGSEIPEIEVHGETNILVGTDDGTGFASFVVLGVNSSGEVGFYKRDNVVLPPHKAGYPAPMTGGLQDYDKQSNQKW